MQIYITSFFTLKDLDPKVVQSHEVPCDRVFRSVHTFGVCIVLLCTEELIDGFGIGHRLFIYSLFRAHVL